MSARAGEAVGVLADLRRAVLNTGVGIMGTATHPAADEEAAEVSDRERYRFIAEQLGDALVTPVAAVHVHVGMADAETAVRAFNGLRRHLPLVEALGANSPFRHGRDTGFASARELALRAWARSGAPRAMADYADFVAYADRLTRGRGCRRLHLPLVEAAAASEARDGRDPRARRAVVARARRVARRARARARAPRGDRRPASRAPARDPRGGVVPRRRSGLAAELPDNDGRLRPAREVLEETLALAAIPPTQPAARRRWPGSALSSRPAAAPACSAPTTKRGHGRGARWTSRAHSRPRSVRPVILGSMNARAVAVAVIIAAAAAPAAQAASWKRVTTPDGASSDEVGLARTADGVLHVAWHHPTGPNTADLLHTVISAAGKVGATSPVQSGWTGFTNPALVVEPGGGLRVFWGGFRSTDSSDPQNETNTALSRDGAKDDVSRKPRRARESGHWAHPRRWRWPEFEQPGRAAAGLSQPVIELSDQKALQRKRSARTDRRAYQGKQDDLRGQQAGPQRPTPWRAEAAAARVSAGA